MGLSELQEIYTQYAQALGQAHRKSSIFSGLFGQGSFDDPRSAPCNQEFYEKAGVWVSAFAASDPKEGEVYAVCRYMLEAAKINEKKPAYWYYLVAQGYVKSLIPLLRGSDRTELGDQYIKWYPRRTWLPIQQELYQMLK